MHALPRRHREGGEAAVEEELGQAAARGADAGDERRLDLRPRPGGDEPGTQRGEVFPGRDEMRLHTHRASFDSRLRSIALRSNPKGPTAKRSAGSARMRKTEWGIFSF